MPQDSREELLQGAPGLDAELVDERPPGRRGSPGAPRPDAPSDTARASAARAAVRGKAGDSTSASSSPTSSACPPALEVGVDPLLERGEAQLVEPPDLALRESLVGEVGERRPAPERQAQLEALGLARRHAKRARIARASCSKRPRSVSSGAARSMYPGGLVSSAVGSERLPQLGDHVLKRGRRRPRWVLAPELVEEPVGGDDTSRVERKQTEERALLLAAEHESALRRPTTSRGPRTRILKHVLFVSLVACK